MWRRLLMMTVATALVGSLQFGNALGVPGAGGGTCPPGEDCGPIDPGPGTTEPSGHQVALACSEVLPSGCSDTLRDVLNAFETSLNDVSSRLGTLEGLSIVDRLAVVDSLVTEIAAVNSRIDTLGSLLEGRILALEDRLAALESNRALELAPLADHLNLHDAELNGLAGPHLIFHNVNVHIQSGAGATTNTSTALGNLIVGYNEPAFDESGAMLRRTGSHNIIVGPEHQYVSVGGFVAGRGNTVSGIHASVSGGEFNVASGPQASISGGSGIEVDVANEWAAGCPSSLFQCWRNPSGFRIPHP